MIETIGWIGSLLLSTCGVPLVYDIYKSKNISGTSLKFILWWLSGEILLLIFTIGKNIWAYPILFNYGINIICCIIVLILIFKYRKK
jgi:uncharacterized protein with PQ loop repeat